MAKQTGSIDLKASKNLGDIATDTAQYFWFTSGGSDNGAHITEVDKTTFQNTPTGGNVLATSNGLAVRDGLKELATMEQGGFEAKTYDSNDNEVVIAHLGYGPGTDSGGGTSDAPYYTLGVRNGAIGNYSVAEGNITVASGYTSHAEGYGGFAIGVASHKEGGLNVRATGDNSHAEGAGTLASSHESHAEGRSTEARGRWAHSQNYNTIANKRAQTAIGKYNEEEAGDDDDDGTYALIIGNGTADDARSNALTVDWSGNVADGNGYQFIKCISGSSGNWTYKKYSDGTFDAWYSGSLTYTNDGQLSSYNPTWYRSHVSVTVPSAIGTVSVITYNFSLSSAATFTMMGYSTASGSTLTQYVVRGGGSLASTTNATCYVHGTWS